MSRYAEFLTVVHDVCRYRQMFTCSGSFESVCDYLSGYANGSSDTPLSGDGWRVFGDFVCARLAFPDNYTWSYAMSQCFPDEEVAVQKLEEFVKDFTRRIEAQSPEEVVAAARASAPKCVDGEPERIWSALSDALLRCRRDEIEPLIQPHPDAEILWRGAYPADVAEALGDLARAQPVPRVAGSEAEGSVTVMTSEFGPIRVDEIEGAWRVHAAGIIAMRKAVQGG